MQTALYIKLVLLQHSSNKDNNSRVKCIYNIELYLCVALKGVNIDHEFEVSTSVSVYICVVSITVQVTASPTDCGDTFQSQLKYLLAIKQNCDSAGFYDCCQVRSLLFNLR